MKDYKRMRESLACYEAEQMPRSALYELLLFGTEGYAVLPNKHIETMFINIWGKDQIPVK